MVGKKKGTQCIKRRSPTGGERGNTHKKKTVGGAPPVKSTHGYGVKCETGIAAGGKRGAGGLHAQGSGEKLDEEEEFDCAAGKGRSKHTKSGKSDEAMGSLMGGGRGNTHKKKTMGGAPPVKSAHGHGGKHETGIAAGGKRGAGGLNAQGSGEKLDEEEEVDCTAGKGRSKHTKSGKSDEAMESLAAKVPEAYRSMFRHVQELQNTEEMREDDTDDEEGLGGGSEKRWHPHGLPSDDEDYEACTRDRETAKLSPSSRAALPQLRVEDIPRIMQDTGPLAFEMLQLTFPPQAVELVRDMTNEYFESSQNREPDTGREKRHEATKFPEEGITDDDVLGMLGILIHMGLVRTCRFANAWSLHPNYNFPHVRNCMPCDFWYLLYTRFLHFAPAGVKTGDKLHHIRKLEEILNSAWSSAADIGTWLSFDDQIVKDTSKAGRSLHRFNLIKPMERGIRAWGVAFFFTAITNAYLLKKMWVLELTEGIDKELELVGPLAEDEVKEGPMAGTSRGTLVELKKRLRRVERKEKAKWDMDLCDYLMAKCNRGHADKDLRQHLRTPKQVPPPPRPASAAAKWEKPLPASGRVCDNPECGSRTKGACRCTDCASGVVMCMKCFLSDTAHAAARTARFAQERPLQTRRKRPIDWSKFDRQQRQRNTPNV